MQLQAPDPPPGSPIGGPLVSRFRKAVETVEAVGAMKASMSKSQLLRQVMTGLHVLDSSKMQDHRKGIASPVQPDSPKAPLLAPRAPRASLGVDSPRATARPRASSLDLQRPQPMAGQDMSSATRALEALRGGLDSPATSAVGLGATSAGEAAAASRGGPAMVPRRSETPEPGSSIANASAEHGVSLAWLQKLALSLSKAGIAEHASTRSVVVGHLLPMLRQATTSHCLWDVIPQEACGYPDYYVVHTWQAPFQATLKQVLAKLNPAPQPNQPPPPPVDVNKVYVWIDAVALPQTNELCSKEDPEWDFRAVRDRVVNCSKGTLVAMDTDLALMGRTWCLVETFLTVYNQDLGRLHMLMPDTISMESAWKLQQLCSTADITHSDTTRPEDKQALVREMKHGAGISRVHKLLQEALSRSLRAALRWSDFNHSVMYCGLLTLGGEYGILAFTLSQIPELAIDQDALDEIRQVFELYDQDGSGELDVEEFVSALGSAGYEEARAREIYDKVNTDGDGGVSIEEFEAWWIESQRQQWLSYQRTEGQTMNVESLCKMLRSFTKWLERNNTVQHLPFFREQLKRLEDGSVMPLSRRLAMVPLAGDWQQTLSQLSYLINTDNTKGACNLMFNFLQSNSDMLEINASQIAPLEKGSVQRAQYEVLVQYLDLAVSLFKWYPEMTKQLKHLSSVAQHFKTKLNCYDAPSTVSKFRKVKCKSKTGADKKNTKRMYELLSDMVHLKYGDDQPVDPHLFQEAGTALGRWMARNRQAPGGSDNIHSFTVDYLAAENGQGSPKGSPKVKPESSNSDMLVSHTTSCPILKLPAISGSARSSLDHAGSPAGSGRLPVIKDGVRSSGNLCLQ